MTKSIEDQIELQEKLKQQADEKLKDLKKRQELKSLRDENKELKAKIAQFESNDMLDEAQSQQRYLDESYARIEAYDRDLKQLKDELAEPQALYGRSWTANDDGKKFKVVAVSDVQRSLTKILANKH